MMPGLLTSATALAETTSFSRAAFTRTRAPTARISEPTLLGSTRRWRTSNNFSASTACQPPNKRGSAVSPRTLSFVFTITTHPEKLMDLARDISDPFQLHCGRKITGACAGRAIDNQGDTETWLRFLYGSLALFPW